MSTELLTRLETAYGDIQGRFEVTPGTDELAEAVQFSSNRSRPIHRWFHFKEGFSPDIFQAVGVDVSALNDPEGIFVDPYLGVATTLLAADLQYKWKCRKFGVEVNPFIAFVAATKTGWRKYDPRRLKKLADEILSEPLLNNIDSQEWPKLTTFHNADIFSAKLVSNLVDLIRRVRHVTEPERDLLLLGIAAAVDRLGFYRKDGRALRVLRSDTEIKERKRLRIKTILKRIWSGYARDLRALQHHRKAEVGESQVLSGSGCNLTCIRENGIESNSVGNMTYSPPYLNHIDYTEVYKVELWLLGFVSTQDEMLEQRRRTLRSHASIKVTATDDGLPGEVVDALEIANTAVTTTGKKWHDHFHPTALGYCQDIKASLEAQRDLLQPGGHTVCVVANSAHGSGEHRVPVAIDLLIASIAEAVGLQVEALKVARQLRRRDHLNTYLRETAIVMRKPEAE